MSSNRTKRRKIAAEVARIVASAYSDVATDEFTSIVTANKNICINCDKNFFNLNEMLLPDAVNCNSSNISGFDLDHLNATPRSLPLEYASYSTDRIVESGSYVSSAANLELMECSEWVPRHFDSDDDITDFSDNKNVADS